ncbi:DUF5625 family protein [Rickettsiales bacterium]|nr:DUF5625 family protein [Rickettsiales bacterium]
MFSKNKLPTTPVSMQIDLSKKGNKAEIDLRIESKEEKEKLEPESTAFELQFIPYDPRHDKNSKYYEGFWRRNLQLIDQSFGRKYTDEEKDEIWEDNEKLTKLLGGGFTVNDGSKYGKHIDYPAIPIPDIHLTIISLDDPEKKVVFDEILKVKKHPSTAGYFHKWLNRVNIKPGKYKIIATTTSDTPEFFGTEIMLRIGSYRSKV